MTNTPSAHEPFSLSYDVNECPLTQTSFDVHLVKHNHDDAYYLARAKLEVFNKQVNEWGQDWLWALRDVSKSYFFHMGLLVASRRGRHTIYFQSSLREAIKEVTDIDAFDDETDEAIFKYLCNSNEREFNGFALQYQVIYNSILHNNRSHPLVRRLEASKKPVEWLDKYLSGDEVWIQAQLETARLEKDKPYTQYKIINTNEVAKNG